MIFGHESSKLEFKEKVPEHDQLIKTVIAFSNTYGGKIVIGVQDNGTILGIDEEIAHKCMEWIGQAIYEACTPPIIPMIYQQRIDSKVLIIIEVSQGTYKPYYQKSLELSKGTFVRLGRSTMQANADMIEELRWQSRGISYDLLPVYQAKKENLDDSKIATFISHRRNGRSTQLSDSIKLAYNILTKEHNTLYPTVAGLLLFGQDPQKFLSESYILCSHFSGISGRDAIASRQIAGTLFEQFDSAYDFVESRLNKSFQIIKRKREEALELPPQALREVIMNAILHRNYHINAPVKIAIYNDRVEVFSPGIFPGPVDINDLEAGITYVRNTAIAKIMWETKYIEKMGSGFHTIFNSYRQYNLQDPQVIEGTNFVKCILPRKKKLGVEKSDELLVINLFHLATEISRSDLIQQLKISKTSAGRLLSRLVQEGRLQMTGKGRNTKYQLKK